MTDQSATPRVADDKRHTQLLHTILDQMLVYTAECNWRLRDVDVDQRTRFYRMKFRQQMLRIEQLARELGGDL